MINSCKISMSMSSPRLPWLGEVASLKYKGYPDKSK